MTAGALVAAVAAALFYALAAALQQHAAAQTATPAGLRLVGRLLTRPRWLAGLAATVADAALHVVALRLGPLALVQPIGVTGLVFALPLGAALHGRPVTRRELVAAVAVACGLIGLLVSVQVSAGAPTISERATAVLAVATAGTALASALAAHRLPGRPRTVVLAIGAGVAFGVTSALVRVVAHDATAMGALPAVANWNSAALVAAAVTGLLLSQSAYQAGSLAAALPTLTVVDPLVAITVGELLLGEPVRFSTAGQVGAALAGAVIIAGTVTLARNQAHQPQG